MSMPSIGLFMTPPDASMAGAQTPAQWGGYSRMRASGAGAARGGPGAAAGAGGRPGAGRAGVSTGHAATAAGSSTRQQLSQVGQQAPLSQMQGAGVADASPALLSQDAAGIAALHSAGAETASQTLSFTPADVIFPPHDYTSQQSQSIDNALLSQR